MFISTLSRNPKEMPIHIRPNLNFNLLRIAHTHTSAPVDTWCLCTARGVRRSQKVCTRVAANNEENNKSQQIIFTELSNFGKVNQGVFVNKKLRIRMLKTKLDATTLH